MIVGCKVCIIEILDDTFYPGMCKVMLEDYNQKKHYFIDKPPVFGFDLDDISELPYEGVMRVELLRNMGDLVEISTEMPDDIESEDGCYNFIVSKKIICPLN